MTNERTQGVVSWEDSFMNIAFVIRQRSKDPNTQVGAVIVDKDNRVLSLGYNGAPRGFDDAKFPWNREAEKPEDTKYPYVIHAERNAILNFRGVAKDLEGTTLYVTHFPCNECAKEIIQSGISNVVYFSQAQELQAESVRLFQECGVEVKEY